MDTPLGDLSVRGDAVPEDVGVAVYPGARPLEDGDEAERANVFLSSPFVDLRVAALKYLSDDQPDAIAEFYRRSSPPTERSRSAAAIWTSTRRRPAVQDAAVGRRGQLQVGVGSKGNFRLASVKPRGTGSEFAVVYVRASNDL